MSTRLALLHYIYRDATPEVQQRRIEALQAEIEKVRRQVNPERWGLKAQEQAA